LRPLPCLEYILPFTSDARLCKGDPPPKVHCEAWKWRRRSYGSPAFASSAVPRRLAIDRKPSLRESGMMRLTAEFTLVEDGWYMVRCLEVDGAISQGRYLEEARDMIRDAIRMMLEDDPERAGREFELREIFEEAPCESS
jgi:predicted RNase H-like HicB family nuclease